MSITHVVLDLDGLLLDTETIFSSINVKLLSSYGKEFTPHIELQLAGTSTDEAVKILLREAKLDMTPAQYMKEFSAELDKRIGECPELPGASRLIDYFYSNNIPMAICSGSSKEEFDQKTQRFKDWLDKIPVHVLCGDPEITHAKPHPEPYLVAMKRLKSPDPQKVLTFEDSVNGVRSALAAGAKCIMIPQPQTMKEHCAEQLKEIQPQLVDMLNSLEDFDPTRFGLPPF